MIGVLFDGMVRQRQEYWGVVQKMNRRNWGRVVLAGPLAFLCAFALVCAASVWLPPGPAMIDNIAIPLVLFPAIWAALFFYCYLASNLTRAYGVVLIALAANGGLIAWHMGSRAVVV